MANKIVAAMPRSYLPSGVVVTMTPRLSKRVAIVLHLLCVTLGVAHELLRALAIVLTSLDEGIERRLCRHRLRCHPPAAAAGDVLAVTGAAAAAVTLVAEAIHAKRAGDSTRDRSSRAALGLACLVCYVASSSPARSCPAREPPPSSKRPGERHAERTQRVRQDRRAERSFGQEFQRVRFRNSDELTARTGRSPASPRAEPPRFAPRPATSYGAP